MDNVNFGNHLNSLINELSLLKNSNGDDTSYKYLLKQLSELSVDNFENQKKMILHFIIDSYDGDINAGNRIMEFLQSYKID